MLHTVQDFDWDKLRIFLLVAEAGSLTHAGDSLQLSQSAVSRQVSALETSLGVILFHRHARGLILTEQGEILYKTVKEVFSRLTMTTALITESRERPSGPLTVTTTVDLGVQWLTPHLKEFSSLYPEIALTLLVDDRELDLGMRQADVAIRLSPPRQPDLIQRHLMTLHYHLYAHESYLEKYLVPEKPHELNEHYMILYASEQVAPVDNINWVEKYLKKKLSAMKKIFYVNSTLGVFHAVNSGMGIGSLPDYLVADNPQLKRILPDLEATKADAYFVYPEELRNSKRISVFRDFLISKIDLVTSW